MPFSFIVSGNEGAAPSPRGNIAAADNIITVMATDRLFDLDKILFPLIEDQINIAVALADTRVHIEMDI